MARVKNNAVGPVPQTESECRTYIRRIGEHQRDRDRIQADMNDEIARVQDKFAKLAAPHNKQVEELTAGVQAYCEAHRNTLTKNGKRKTADLGTGEIGWRITPPKIALRAVATIIDAIRAKRVGKLYLRTKVEIDKDAIGRDLKKVEDEWQLPEKLQGIPGLTVKSVEEFFIKPSETDLEEVA